jgi:hypothetical protein
MIDIITAGYIVGKTVEVAVFAMLAWRRYLKQRETRARINRRLGIA